jgi:hypothetical protein
MKNARVLSTSIAIAGFTESRTKSGCNTFPFHCENAIWSASVYVADAR